MSLNCDYREHSINKIFDLRNIKYQVENLTIGDFVIYNDDKTQSIIVERKTLDDLSASITDNRYKEQSSRLQEVKSENVTIMYIIEGISKTNKKGVPYSTLLSAMQSMCIKHGFFVMRSKSTEETCDILNILCKKINEINTKSAIQPVVSNKKSYTNESVYIQMLSCIPGISIKTAILISEHHKNIYDLCIFLKNGSESLCNIPKIGKATSIKIHDYLLNIK